MDGDAANSGVSRRCLRLLLCSVPVYVRTASLSVCFGALPQVNSPDLTAWQKEEPDELVQRMENNGVKPGLMSFNVLIDACARVREQIVTIYLHDAEPTAVSSYELFRCPFALFDFRGHRHRSVALLSGASFVPVILLSLSRGPLAIFSRLVYM